MKTPITYYGGSQGMLPNIIKHIPQHTNYCEPFFGGGAVFFAKPAAKIETINDINGLVVNFYEQLKTNFDNLLALIDSSIISHDQHKRAMTLCRCKTASPVEKAWGFWYRCNFSFAAKFDGGLKFSKKSYSSVPSQLKKKKQNFTIRLKHRIENASIWNVDAIDCIKRTDSKETFFYVHPPYVGADQGHYKGYTENDFRNLLAALSEIKGKFMLGMYPDPILNEYINDFNWIQLKFDKPLLANRKNGNPRKTEALVMNYEREFNQGSLFEEN